MDYKKNESDISKIFDFFLLYNFSGHFSVFNKKNREMATKNIFPKNFVKSPTYLGTLIVKIQVQLQKRFCPIANWNDNHRLNRTFDT